MKKPSAVTLSVKLYYKSLLLSDSTRNIIMLLSFQRIHSSIRQYQIPAVYRILLRNHVSPQEALSVLFLYKYPKNRDKSSLKFSEIPSEFKCCKIHSKIVLFHQIFVYENFFADFSLFNLYVMFISWSSSHFSFLSSLPPVCSRILITDLNTSVIW